MSDFDEFSLLHENASEAGLPLDRLPPVRRVAAGLSDGRQISGLAWGMGDPAFLLLHGGGQNAHTWDTVALALGQNLLALDLPGHGHSDGPGTNEDVIGGYAEDIAVAATALAPDADMLVGMSAGGLTAIALLARQPERFRHLMLVDILPGPDPHAARAIADFLDGPPAFDTLDEMIARAIAFNPQRSASSLRRGVIHNAVQLPDGRWQWRHQRHRRSLFALPPEQALLHYEALWRILASSPVPVSLVRGMEKGSVVTDAQERRLKEMRPDAIIHHVEGAGHSVQGDRPVELAHLISGLSAR